MFKHKPRKEIEEFVLHTMLVDLLEVSESEEEDEIFEDALMQLDIIQTERYLTERTRVQKSCCLINELLPMYDDVRFRRTVRMNREQFQKLHNLIKHHHVFTTLEGNYYPVAVQLLIVLNRSGTYGNAAGIMAIARNFGIGDGGTLNIFTKRVITAILAIENQFINWPTENERKTISDYMAMQLLPNCIGFLDGTHVILENAPRDDAISYFNRKGQYSFNLLLIADPFKKICYYHVGQPGKVHDARVFSLTDISKNPTQFFSGQEYIVGDPAYKLTTTVITPYRNKPGLTRDQEKFNHHISKKRMAIEHVNGMLKSRFGSLKGLRMVIDRESGHKFACQWITACLILYNMLKDDDPWDAEIEDEIQQHDPNDSGA